MGLRKILTVQEPALHKVCKGVVNFDERLHKLLDDMRQTLIESGGVGLAAPQVGVLSRFLVMMDPDSETVYKMINPEIISRSDTQCTMEEGCLSVLGHDGIPVYANVSRPESVVVEWMDENGNKQMAQMSGLPARIVQHETDHLDGKLFIDYLSPLRREMLMRKVRKLKK